MLSERHCALFDRPFFQFAQLKKYYPEEIPKIKQEYRQAWQDWCETIRAVSLCLDNALFAQPHIERWCNGWQVRAHFFAYFKYQIHADAAVIFSIILNRRRLMIYLDWHAYRANQSVIPLTQYQNWLPEILSIPAFQDFYLWRDDDSEYDDYLSVANHDATEVVASIDNGHFFRVGKVIEKNELITVAVVEEITQIIKQLQPIYERCFSENSIASNIVSGKHEY